MIVVADAIDAAGEADDGHTTASGGRTPTVAGEGARAKARAGRSQLFASPIGVAFVVFLVYALWLEINLPVSQGARAFTLTGNAFLQRSHASAVISAVPPLDNDPHGSGYDGQFVYYMALDPVHARSYIDLPAYRYGRVLLAMLARLVTLGTPSAIPYALVLINIAALVLGTYLIAAWLARRRVSPWFALFYSFSPGLYYAVRCDLTEPLAFMLAALGVYLFDSDGRRQWWAATAFGLALFARETTFLFPLVCAATLPHGGQDTRAGSRQQAARLGRTAAFALIAFGPYGLYRIFLRWWLGDWGIPGMVSPTHIPFQGLFAYYPWDAPRYLEIQSLVLPSLIFAGAATWAIRRGAGGDYRIWLLLGNVALYVVFLNASTWGILNYSARGATGVILSALLMLPTLDRLTGRNRAWLWAGGVLWVEAMISIFLVPTGDQLARVLLHSAG